MVLFLEEVDFVTSLKEPDTTLHTSHPSEATSDTSRLFFTVRHLLATAMFILLKLCMALEALTDLYRAELISLSLPSAKGQPSRLS